MMTGSMAKRFYDSTSGSGSFGKFISAEEKIEEMVGQLFPSP